MFTYNLLGLKRTRWEGAEAWPPATIRSSTTSSTTDSALATLAYNNLSGVGRGGTGTLKVDGKIVSTQKLERSVPMVLPFDQTFDIGTSGATPVDDGDYKVPFPFAGKIRRVTIALDPPKLTPDDVKKLEAASRAAQDS